MFHVLLSGEFITAWDDGSLVVFNTMVHALNGETLKWIFTNYDPELYIPLTFLSFQIEHLLFGLNPFFFHLTNIFLQILNASFLFVILRKFLQEKWIALFLALLFVVHPINTEAVAWISARKDLLSTFFALLSFVCYLQYRSHWKKHWFVGSLILFLLALLSKVTVLMLPVVLMMVDLAQDKRIDKRTLLEKIPFFILSAIFLWIALQGKASNVSGVPFDASLILMLKSIGLTLQHLVWPFGLNALYPHEGSLQFFSASTLVPAILLVCFVFGAWWFRKRSWLPLIGLIFFLVTYIPTAATFEKAGLIFITTDRYAYIPMMGLLLALGGLLSSFPYRKKPFTVIGVVLIILCVFQSNRVSVQWLDNEHFLEEAITSNKHSGKAHFIIARVYHYHEDVKDVDRAVQLYRKAISLRPDLPRSYNSLGSIYLDRGEVDAAIPMFRKAIEIHEGFALAHSNLGAALGQKGLYEEGLYHLQRALELDGKTIDLVSE